jgi:hypothetical protein
VYEAAIAAIEQHVRATYKPHGFVIAGSLMRGEGGPTSDFDVFIAHAEGWRHRDQRWFDGYPTELFVNPPDRIRSYMKNEHAEGRPCTAHMLTTGALRDADDVMQALVREAHAWMHKPIEITDDELTAKRYAIVDSLDDARDALPTDRASAIVLLAEAVSQTVAYAFWSRRMFQPRRKDLARALAAIDPIAAEHLRGFADDPERAFALAKHVLGVDTFFAWTSLNSE